MLHKWQLNQDLLPTGHPYFATSPYGGVDQITEVEIIGGDKPILQIYWGDEWIDTNSTIVDDTNDSHWDYVLDINGGNPVSMGIYEVPLQNLTLIKHITTEHILRILAVANGQVMYNLSLQVIQDLQNIRWMDWFFG